MNFNELKVGEEFCFPSNPHKVYRKVEEGRRPYTPEAYSNAIFTWFDFNPMTGEMISKGETFFYVSSSQPIIKL